jgi:hypothetical protein
MRIVGKKDRTAIELDPVKAYHQARILDAMLRAALPPYPRGVTRGTHESFNQLDEQRRIQIARVLNEA